MSDDKGGGADVTTRGHVERPSRPPGLRASLLSWALSRVAGGSGPGGGPPWLLRGAPACDRAPWGAAPHTGASGGGRLFGKPLASVCNGDKLPDPIMDMLRVLRREGPLTGGIFRKSAGVRACRQLKERMDRGEWVAMGSQCVLVIAAVLKDFLRSIPGGVLTEELRRAFITAMAHGEDTHTLTDIRRLSSQLPSPHNALLRHVLCLLHHVGRSSPTNQMPPCNLAVCIAPSIAPYQSPTVTPSVAPYVAPYVSPYVSHSIAPSVAPYKAPNVSPNVGSSLAPSVSPYLAPNVSPSVGSYTTPSIAPSMHRSRGAAPTSPANQSRETAQVSLLVQFLIENCRQIFGPEVTTLLDPEPINLDPIPADAGRPESAIFYTGSSSLARPVAVSTTTSTTSSTTSSDRTSCPAAPVHCGTIAALAAKHSGGTNAGSLPVRPPRHFLRCGGGPERGAEGVDAPPPPRPRKLGVGGALPDVHFWKRRGRDQRWGRGDLTTSSLSTSSATSTFRPSSTSSITSSTTSSTLPSVVRSPTSLTTSSSTLPLVVRSPTSSICHTSAASTFTPSNTSSITTSSSTTSSNTFKPISTSATSSSTLPPSVVRTPTSLTSTSNPINSSTSSSTYNFSKLTSTSSSTSSNFNPIITSSTKTSTSNVSNLPSILSPTFSSSSTPTPSTSSTFNPTITSSITSSTTSTTSSTTTSSSSTSPSVYCTLRPRSHRGPAIFFGQAGSGGWNNHHHQQQQQQDWVLRRCSDPPAHPLAHSPAHPPAHPSGLEMLAAYEWLKHAEESYV